MSGKRKKHISAYIFNLPLEPFKPLKLLNILVSKENTFLFFLLYVLIAREIISSNNTKSYLLFFTFSNRSSDTFALYFP